MLCIYRYRYRTGTVLMFYKLKLVKVFTLKKVFTLVFCEISPKIFLFFFTGIILLNGKKKLSFSRDAKEKFQIFNFVSTYNSDGNHSDFRIFIVLSTNKYSKNTLPSCPLPCDPGMPKPGFLMKPETYFLSGSSSGSYSYSTVKQVILRESKVI